MIKKILILFIVLLVFGSVKGQTFSLMTYNVRYGLADDGENSWEFRKDFLTSQINFYNPDIFGIQEGLPFQVEFIDSQLLNHMLHHLVHHL